MNAAGAADRRLILYYVPHSCARVTMVALEQIGVPYELRVVNKLAGDNLREWFVALNPKGKVPVLQAGSRVLTETPAILAWLARTFPDAELLPGREPALTDAAAMMSWFASGIHPIITRTRFPGLVCDAPAAHAPIREMGQAALAEAFAILEGALEDREWLFDEWSVVDAYLNWLWFRATGSGMPASSFARCAAHTARVETWPSVAKAIARESAIAEGLAASGFNLGLPPLEVTARLKGKRGSTLH